MSDTKGAQVVHRFRAVPVNRRQEEELALMKAQGRVNTLDGYPTWSSERGYTRDQVERLVARFYPGWGLQVQFVVAYEWGDLP